MTVPFAIWSSGVNYEPCSHATARVRKKRTASNGWSLRKQCDHCGAGVGPVLRQAGFVLSEVPEFDEELERRWRRLYSQRIEDRRADFFEWYNAYLRSPEWKHRRQLVLKRDNFICQGCLEQPATMVHHLTYEHVGNELLWELQSICDDCHEKAHPEKHEERQCPTKR